jgi:hypothetical protein
VGVALLDSSASIGYLDADDALHLDAVRTVEALLRGGSPLAISALSWAEILNGAHRGHHDVGTAAGS